MSRVSCDQYRLPDGTLVDVPLDTFPPNGATLWKGYDYNKQCWVFEGKRDTRSIDELQYLAFATLAHPDVNPIVYRV